MAEIDQGKWFPLGRASGRVPGNPHVGTLTRWALRGVLTGPAGERLKLATKKVGGRRFTCQAWVDEFIARTSGERLRPEPLAGDRAGTLAADERELDQDGLA